MTESIHSTPHKLRDCIIIGILFLLLIGSILSLTYGDKDAVVIVSGCAIALLILLLPPKWSYIIAIPMFGMVDKVASRVSQSLDQMMILDGLDAIISTIGIVSFLLTYINAARERKIKGILMEDVINTFYPGYKLILMLNGAVACLGRFACKMNIGLCAIMCFAAMLCCLTYMLFMANDVAFSEKRARQLTSKYIRMISQNLMNKEPTSICSLNVASFICSVGNYLALYYNGNEFSVSFSRHEDDIESLLPLMKCDTNGKLQKLSGIEHTTLLTFEQGKVSELQNNKEVDNLCECCFVYRIPNTEELRSCVENEVLFACDMWRSILDKIENEQVKVQAICQIICIENNLDRNLSGILECGLLRYIHDTNIPAVTPADANGWRKSLHFLYSIYCAVKQATSDRSEFNLKNYQVDKDLLCRQCVDMIMTQICLVKLEQSFLEEKISEEAEKDYNTILYSILIEETRKEGKREIDDSLIKLYIYRAFLILRMRPLMFFSKKTYDQLYNAYRTLMKDIQAYCNNKR